ncbi:CaiB/BaiF CoA transferase family protein [Chromohalobacter japonicus]|uniref:CaiB/BaiF CoA transferase family protein n=1 Tax=Chromohalobacter japonicus TaxID=223900 RepID=UPI001FF3CB0B|nr:CoA transferase [Chromohalobacter japonicus]MCK0754349.1 CoA transferase [Chromohalobacter japonicus]
MKPLSGITVLELGMVMQVPLAAQMLGDYGANVIKIERPPRGDIMRDLDEVGTERNEMSCYYAAVGRNKRTLCLDLKQDEGREVLGKLIEQADVLVHNFRPGAMERLGFGYEQVSAINPRLIYAVGYAFGATGPLAGLPGQDMLAQSLSGFALNGVEPEGNPRLTATPTVDYATAVSLTQGILAALFARERTGAGELVTTSLYDVAIAMQLLEVASNTMYGYRTDWLKYAIVLPTKDGWVTVLTLFRDNPLKLLCEAFEVEDMSVDPDLSNASLQIKNIEKVKEKFAPVISKYSTDECIDRLVKTDILCAPVLDIEQAIHHPQAKENNILWEADVPNKGPKEIVGNPVKLLNNPLEMKYSPSRLGEYSVEVLYEFGYKQEEINHLENKGVIISG